MRLRLSQPGPSASADDRRHGHDQSTVGCSEADQIVFDVRAYASFRRIQLSSKHRPSADGAGKHRFDIMTGIGNDPSLVEDIRFYGGKACRNAMAGRVQRTNDRPKWVRACRRYGSSLRSMLSMLTNARTPSSRVAWTIGQSLEIRWKNQR